MTSMGMAKKVLLLVVVVLGCMWTHVVAEGEGERTPFLEAFPNADPKEFGNVAAVAQGYETKKHEETRPFVSACPSIPVPPDTNNVNQLKPGHIKVVMAMGDSITAAMSAKDTQVTNLREYRGISYAIGGDPGVVTLPNILKQYTAPNYPLGVSTGIGKRESHTNGFNAAVSGEINSGMYQQAVWLYDQLVTHPNVNMDEDWKVCTIFIGSNNLCQVCNDKLANDAEDFRKNINQTLQFLLLNIPRLFVNLVGNMDITKIYNVQSGLCPILHPVECPCPSSANPLTRNAVKDAIKHYFDVAYEIQRWFTTKRNPGFACVVQPFLENSPIYDRTFLSSADCFHPSAIAHQAMSVALWNAMITPASQKKTTWDRNETAICATSDTMLWTG